ncbi:unnamed protein product [Dicrocoelium dendriticum]|nr:unnamed protein product [Dicrocoelium dendriticum]
MCNFPSADFALSYGGLPALTQGQLYTIVVDFAIPDSPFNQASGMSLLTVELFDADGNRTMLFRKSVSIKLLASLLSLRVLFTFPLIFSVPYRSNLLRLANRLVLLPLYLTGVIGEEMQLSVPLSADFQDLQVLASFIVSETF